MPGPQNSFENRDILASPSSLINAGRKGGGAQQIKRNKSSALPFYWPFYGC